MGSAFSIPLHVRLIDEVVFTSARFEHTPAALHPPDVNFTSFFPIFKLISPLIVIHEMLLFFSFTEKCNSYGDGVVGPTVVGPAVVGAPVVGFVVGFAVVALVVGFAVVALVVGFAVVGFA